MDLSFILCLHFDRERYLNPNVERNGLYMGTDEEGQNMYMHQQNIFIRKILVWDDIFGNFTMKNMVCLFGEANRDQAYTTKMVLHYLQL